MFIVVDVSSVPVDIVVELVLEFWFSCLALLLLGGLSLRLELGRVSSGESSPPWREAEVVDVDMGEGDSSSAGDEWEEDDGRRNVGVVVVVPTPCPSWFPCSSDSSPDGNSDSQLADLVILLGSWTHPAQFTLICVSCKSKIKSIHLVKRFINQTVNSLQQKLVVERNWEWTLWIGIAMEIDDDDENIDVKKAKYTPSKSTFTKIQTVPKSKSSRSRRIKLHSI